jgi:hypothetical protein
MRTGTVSEKKLELPIGGQYVAISDRKQEESMRVNMRWAIVVCLLAGIGLVWADAQAFAQCPPGTHWSNRYWQCVRNRMPPPPPPPPPARPLPPPPPHRHHGCERSYDNCLRVCGGVPACVNNCNIGYGVCRQQRGW